MRSALRAEYARLFARPWDELAVIGANGALMCAGWFLLPDGLRAWLFSLHGALAFPFVLETWMLADTPATNVLGADTSVALSVLGDDAALRRWLWAKHLALTSLVAPVCAAIAIVVAVEQLTVVAALMLGVILIVAPLGTLSISVWLGIVWPYHQRPLRWRWAHRRDPVRSARWLLLLVTPYTVVPAIASVLTLPSVTLWNALRGPHTGRRLTDSEFLAGTTLLVLVTATAAVLGERGALWLVRRRHAPLVTFLNDPEQG